MVHDDIPPSDDDMLDTIVVRSSTNDGNAPGGVLIASTNPEEVESSAAIPQSYTEAMSSTDKQEWLTAMKQEYSALTSMHTWSLVRREQIAAAGHNIIDCRWVYSRKHYTKPSGAPGTKYKARLVIKGFQQFPGVDFNETFAPVGRLETLRMLMGLAAHFDWEIEQLDVCTAFLNGKLTEDEMVYMKQPEGFEQSKTDVCALHNALYGLKQAPQIWHKTIHNFLINNYFERSNFDSNLYILERFGSRLFLLL